MSATLVLAAASMLAGREGRGPDHGYPVGDLESGAAGAVADRALEVSDVPAISVRQARIKNNKGTPKLLSSALADLDIPQTALLAYQRAADVGEVDASCGLSWTLLAAIGRRVRPRPIRRSRAPDRRHVEP